MSRTILKRPLITEKTMRLVTEGRYVFEVAKAANKKEISAAIHDLFSVDVDRVRTYTRAGKTKRVLRTRRETQLPTRKFAIVSLKNDQKIEGFEKLIEIEEDAD